jgi:hypothetical protein
MNIIDRLFRIFILFMCIVIPQSNTLGSVVGLTNGKPITATRQEYCFDNSGLLIGGYGMKHKDESYVQYAKQAGLDFVITDVTEEFLTLCDEYDLGVIANNYASLPYGNTAEWLKFNGESYVCNHKSVWGHDLTDEPTAQAFSDIAAATNHFYSQTDGKIALVNLFPMYASSEQLGVKPQISGINKLLYYHRDAATEEIDSYKRYISDYINTIDTDYICADIYPLYETSQGEARTSRSWLRNLDILGEACRKTGRDLWIIAQSTGVIKDGSAYPRYCDNPEDIRWQSFVTLSFGSKAIIFACYDGGWWDSKSHSIDQDGNRTQTYYAIQQVSNELHSFSKIYGDYTNKGAYLINKLYSAGSYEDAFLMSPETEKPCINSRDPLLVGCFDGKDGDSKAYTVVNMSEPREKSDADFTLKFDKNATATVYRKGIAQSYDSGKLSLTLESGEGVFITVK